VLSLSLSKVVTSKLLRIGPTTPLRRASHPVCKRSTQPAASITPERGGRLHLHPIEDRRHHMAKRKQLWHPDEVRQKIQTSQLINRLTNHAFSDEPLMDASQVAAARALINKVLPDVSETTFKGDKNAPLVSKIVVEYVDPPKKDA